MKKTIINFQNPLYTVCILALFLLTACQKENIELETKQATSQELTTEIQDVDLSKLDAQLNSNARADSWVIMNEVIQINNGGFHTIRLRVEDLPNPRTHRIDVHVIPLKAPVNLHVRSFNPDRNPQVENFRSSVNPGMEVEYLKFRKSDFRMAETHAYVMIHSIDVINEFEVKIYAVPTDCQEFVPRRELVVNTVHRPVCGCDGRNYLNEDDAFANGITSWDRGQCLPHPIIPINGMWQAIEIDPNRINHSVRINGACITITTTDIDKNGNKESFTFIVCNETDSKDDKESRTWTVVDKGVKGPMIWPVEKWSAQVNGQGELEIFKSNASGKDKDSKDSPQTILHRYKRIK